MITLICDLLFGTHAERYVFCYAGRHSRVWFSYVFLKTVFQIMAQYLLILQNSLEVSKSFSIFSQNYTCASLMF